MILNLPKQNININIMSYFVEAYLSYCDFLYDKDTVKFIFKDKDDYERICLECTFFSDLLVIRKGQIDRLVTIDELSGSESESEINN